MNNKEVKKMKTYREAIDWIFWQRSQKKRVKIKKSDGKKQQKERERE